MNKIALIMQLYHGDAYMAYRMGELCAKLEGAERTDVRWVWLHRCDTPLNLNLAKHTTLAFETVSVQREARDGWPHGPNDLARASFEYIASLPPEFSCGMLLEADAVPMHPGWFRTIRDQFLSTRGEAQLGGMRIPAHNPPFLQGNCIATRAGAQWVANRLHFSNGPWDVENGPLLYHNSINLTSIYSEPKTEHDIDAAWLFRHRTGYFPSYVHGIKGASAQDEVARRHLGGAWNLTVPAIRQRSE